MKILAVFLVFFLVPFTVFSSPQSYPVRTELANQVVQFKESFMELGKDIGSAVEAQPKETGFDGIARNIIDMGYMMLGLNALLQVESFHGGKKQFNNEAIQEVIKYVYFVNSQADLFLEHSTYIISVSKNPTVIYYADKTKQLLVKTKELLDNITQELLKP